jgi:predicted CXXCH cytochrome family protein
VEKVKVFISMFILLIFVAVSAFAADVMTFPAKNGDVTFNHKKHQEVVKDCKACHAKKIGKIEGFGKDMAHKLCIDCHKAKSKEKVKAPVACKDCHKKK